MDSLTTKEQLLFIKTCRWCYGHGVKHLYQHLRIDDGVNLSKIKGDRVDLVRSIYFYPHPSRAGQWAVRFCLERSLPLLKNLTFLDIWYLPGACLHTIPFSAWQNLTELRMRTCFHVEGCPNDDATSPDTHLGLPALKRLFAPLCVIGKTVKYAPGITHIRFDADWDLHSDELRPFPNDRPLEQEWSNVTHVGFDSFHHLMEVFPLMPNVKYVDCYQARDGPLKFKMVKEAVSKFPAVQSVLVLLASDDVELRCTSSGEVQSWGPLMKRFELRTPGRRAVFTRNPREASRLSLALSQHDAEFNFDPLGDDQGWFCIRGLGRSADPLDSMLLLEEPLEDVNS
ncbi:hypothetical protein ONZ45_g19526 [Pleurotus djamor]|nr:hypothetical protein ONZ45_g19526 [Pleurotus djamor]